jgi:hypothetical protein
MVYNTQNYWVFGLCPSSGILETRKHNSILKGSDDGVSHSDLLGFWTLSMVQYSRN